MHKLILIVLTFICAAINAKAINKALVVGIGNYDENTTGWPTIHGNNDVDLLSSKLQDKGFSVISLKDTAATKVNIILALNKIVISAENEDVIYLHFSGHGQPVRDMNNDEVDGLDQSFVCYDACFSSRFSINGDKYYGQNHLIDDEIFPFLNSLKQKVGQNGKVIVVFDSCYSGDADRGERTEEILIDRDVNFSKTTRGSNDVFDANEVTRNYLISIKAPEQYCDGGGKILVISACPRDRKNFECTEKETDICYGSLSYCISKMLDNNLPISEWEDFFTSKKFREYHIFRLTQRPVVYSH